MTQSSSKFHWLAFNGFIGESSVGVLVEAESEEDARRQAEAALAEAAKNASYYGTPESYATVKEIERVELPYIGEFG